MTKRCKRILYIHHGKGLGGAPLSLLYLIKSLDKNQYQPLVLFLHDSDAFDLYKQAGIEVYGPVNRYDFPHTKIWWLRWYHLPYLLRSLKDTFITYWWTADYWLKKLNPDIVHLNTSSLVAWGAVAHNQNIPVVWHIREPLASGYFGLRRWFITACVNKYATAIIPISKSDSKPWENNPKTKVIHNPVDPKIFDPQKYNLNTKAPTILFLGGLSQEKGTLVILTVFQKLLEKLPNAQLLIAGYWTQKQPLREFPKGERLWLILNAGRSLLHLPRKLRNLLPAQRYKNKVSHALEPIKKSVTLLGPITNVPEVMASSHVIVFPATVGHFARPIIEAGFMKKPVVASKLPPLDELVIDGQTGYLVCPKDINAWCDKLYQLLNNTEQRSIMGNQAKQFCTTHFSLTNYYKKIITVYDQILKKGQPHGHRTIKRIG